MFGSDRSSCSTQRLSWESSSNTPSIFSTSQANQTYTTCRQHHVCQDWVLYWHEPFSTCTYCWCLGDPYLCTQRLALYKRGCGISSNPANQGGEQTTISMVTQGILHEVWKWKKNYCLCHRDRSFFMSGTSFFKLLWWKPVSGKSQLPYRLVLSQCTWNRCGLHGVKSEWRSKLNGFKVTF